MEPYIILKININATSTKLYVDFMFLLINDHDILFATVSLPPSPSSLSIISLSHTLSVEINGKNLRLWVMI